MEYRNPGTNTWKKGTVTECNADTGRCQIDSWSDTLNAVAHRGYFSPNDMKGPGGQAAGGTPQVAPAPAMQAPPQAAANQGGGRLAPGREVEYRNPGTNTWKEGTITECNASTGRCQIDSWSDTLNAVAHRGYFAPNDIRTPGGQPGGQQAAGGAPAAPAQHQAQPQANAGQPGPHPVGTNNLKNGLGGCQMGARVWISKAMSAPSPSSPTPPAAGSSWITVKTITTLAGC